MDSATPINWPVIMDYFANRMFLLIPVRYKFFEVKGNLYLPIGLST